MILQNLFGTFSLALALQIVLKIALATLLGGLVGYERERRHMPAGVRTFILVCVGSCIYTILSQIGFPGGDPARVAAQVVSGIGFLGAGVVIQHKGTVYGLTSAAGIWAVAAVGMALGTGNYFLAVAGGIGIYVILGLLRYWLKADVVRSTRRTLNTSLRQIRGQIAVMGNLVEQAILSAVEAVHTDDHDLAQQVIAEDEQINRLRYRVEEDCLDILRTQQPADVQLRTVLAATHVATNLERIGDYARAIAQTRLQMGHEPLLEPSSRTPAMAREVCELLQQVLTAFAQDDVKAARRICEQAAGIDKSYEELVEMVTEQMSAKKTKRFERGANLLSVAYYLKRAGERVINIAERIIFARTGALAELEREAQ
ncbi:MAG: phosphate signaling complex protein PhoU [Anaerolineae bacterium]|nr:phosphate signaling complex protein PhoU [Anaerolineae bacterium]